ncbi:MAG: hypothetical protein AAF074_14605 [Pseudomonadota bacterium]
MDLSIPQTPLFNTASSAAAPPPVEVTASAITSREFSVIDLGQGGQVGVMVHDIPVPVPSTQIAMQYRIDQDDAMIGEFAQPVEPGLQVITLPPGSTHTVELRLVDRDPGTGELIFDDWSPAKLVLASDFQPTGNIVSDTVDPVADVSNKWENSVTWTGPDAEGFVTWTSGAPLQKIATPVWKKNQHMLLSVTVRQVDAPTTRVFARHLAASLGNPLLRAEFDWATETLGAPFIGNGFTDVSVGTVWVDSATKTARLFMAFTTPDADAFDGWVGVEFTTSAFKDIDLRYWTVGDTNFPTPQPIIGLSPAYGLTPPTTTNFGASDTFEGDNQQVWGGLYTVFGDEVADSTIASARTNTITDVTLLNGGSGYTDGAYNVLIAGGTGGSINFTVSGGSIVSIDKIFPGRQYADTPEITDAALQAVAGPGTGASFSITRAQTLKDFWPSINEIGFGTAFWLGAQLGGPLFRVLGFSAHGQVWSAGQPHQMPTGEIITFNADGTWRIDPNGSSDNLPENRGRYYRIGVVVTNGGTQSVIDMPIGITGNGTKTLAIIGLPHIVGSGRYGDQLVALPGFIDPGEAGREGAAYSFQWQKNGTNIPGATDYRSPRLNPADHVLGDRLRCRVTWDDGNGAEWVETNEIAVRGFKAVEDGDSVHIGEWTPPNVVGLPVAAAGTTIVSGNGAGHFALYDDGGCAHLRPVVGPTGNGTNPASGAVLSGPYSLGLSDGRTLTVTVPARTITLASRDDLRDIFQKWDPINQFDLTGGGIVEFWNSGDWGHVDTNANGNSALESLKSTPALPDLLLFGGNDGSAATRLYFQSYDFNERTEVTCVLYADRHSNFEWRHMNISFSPQIDESLHTQGTGFRIFGVSLGTSGYRINNARGRGCPFLRERASSDGAPYGSGIIGGGTDPSFSSMPTEIVAEKVELCDLNSAVGFPGSVDPTITVPVTISDFRFHRCGHDIMGAGPNFERIQMRRGLIYTPMTTNPNRHPDFMQFTIGGTLYNTLPDGTTPTYTDLPAPQFEDCIFIVGLARDAETQMLFLRQDNIVEANPVYGATEARWAAVYQDFEAINCLIVGGIQNALYLSSGDRGVIRDSAFMNDSRGLSEGQLRHVNPSRSLGTTGTFEVTRTITNVLDMDGATTTNVAVVERADYHTAYDDPGLYDYAPRDVDQALAFFTPLAGGPLDIGPGNSDTIGPVNKDGSFKGDLSAVPAETEIPWPVAVSWGRENLKSHFGWGDLTP